MTTSETAKLWNEIPPPWEQFDAAFLHNFGPQPSGSVPLGARALCGAVSTRDEAGEGSPLVNRCCPVCLALTVTEIECGFD